MAQQHEHSGPTWCRKHGRGGWTWCRRWREEDLIWLREVISESDQYTYPPVTLTVFEAAAALNLSAVSMMDTLAELHDT